MPRLIVMMGLSGTGKSFVAKILKEEFGYKLIRSDEVRKKLFNINPYQRVKVGFGEGIYSEEVTRRVYKVMVEEAKKILKEGGKVVLDATFLRDWQRELIRQNFKDYLFVMTVAREETVRERLKSRKDISDADFFIYLKQKETFEEPKEEVLILNTEKDKEEIKEELKKIIGDP